MVPPFAGPHWPFVDKGPDAAAEGDADAVPGATWEVVLDGVIAAGRRDGEGEGVVPIVALETVQEP